MGAGLARPRPALKAPTTRNLWEIVARWLFLAGVLVAGGSALLRFAMGPLLVPSRVVLLAGFVLAAIGGFVLFEQTSVQTRFGLTALAAGALAAVGASLTALAGRRKWLLAPATAAALLLLAAPSASGHALDPGRPRLQLLVDLVHVAAASIWLGGLLSLVVALRASRAGEVVLRRFSTVAVGSVCVLAASGVLRAISELTSVSQLWSTGYGRLLIVKSAILAVLIGLGWANRYRLIPALARSGAALRRNLLAEVALFAALLVAVALLTQSRPGRDRLSANVAAAARAPRNVAKPEPSAGSVVLGQTGRTLELAGAASSGLRVGRRTVLWETVVEESSGSAALVERDLRTRATRVLARNVASQYGLAAGAGWIVYASASSPPRLVLADRDGRTREILSTSLVAPFAALGDRIAWAEQAAGRVRVLVADLPGGHRRILADRPACARSRCYRVDRVTLASGGVAFDLGAIGPQPSLVLRRAFGARRPDVRVVPDDPQPDLYPSSTGALYYALGRGWYRWDFGARDPERIRLPASGTLQPVAHDRSGWIFLAHPGCDGELVAGPAVGRTVPVVTAAQVRAAAGVGPSICVNSVGVTAGPRGLVSTWQLAPRDTHSAEGATSVIVMTPQR